MVFPTPTSADNVGDKNWLLYAETVVVPNPTIGIKVVPLSGLNEYPIATPDVDPSAIIVSLNVVCLVIVVAVAT